MQLTPGETYGFRYRPVGKTNRRHVNLKFQYLSESSNGDISVTFAGADTGFKSFRLDQIEFDKPRRKKRIAKVMTYDGEY